MARAPYQVLVIPYCHAGQEFVFAVLKRRNADVWQFIAGGGEDSEDPLSTAKREAFEEGAILADDWIALDSRALIPRIHFPNTSHWGSSIVAIPEHSFAVRLKIQKLHLSVEHQKARWLSQKAADRVLTFDSNRAALHELHERLRAYP